MSRPHDLKISSTLFRRVRHTPPTPNADPSTESLPKSYPMNVVTQSMSGMLGFAQTGPRSLGMKGARLGTILIPFDCMESFNKFNKHPYSRVGICRGSGEGLAKV